MQVQQGSPTRRRAKTVRDAHEADRIDARANEVTR